MEQRNEPSTAEIVRALKDDALFELGGKSAMVSLDTIRSAIDRLESQEREIEELKSEAFVTALDNAERIAELTARAENAERERDAAIADMKLIVDAVREEHCDETCCFACKFDCDTSINDSGEYGSECPGFDKDDCFEWRGKPQEGEKE